MDMFTDYGARGDAFADAIRRHGDGEAEQHEGGRAAGPPTSIDSQARRDDVDAPDAAKPGLEGWIETLRSTMAKP